MSVLRLVIYIARILSILALTSQRDYREYRLLPVSVGGKVV